MPELEELEGYLRAATILTWGDPVLPGGHPDKHRILLAGGVQVMAKPGHEEPWASVVRREAAGWLVAKAFGFVGLVAATVLRDVPRRSTGDDVLSSVQVTWPDGHDWCTVLKKLFEDEVWEAAVFDAVVAHADHNNNNWLGVPGPPPEDDEAKTHLRLVDTGNAFDLGGGSANSTFYEHHHRDHLPDEINEAIHRFVEHDTSELANLLGEAEAERVMGRAGQLAESGVLHIG